MLYNAYQKGPLTVAGYYDPDEVRQVGIIFAPDVWANDTVYYRQDDENYDIVIPAIFTGVYYRVKTPGLSDNLEPTWIPTAGEITTDGTNGLTWEAVNYNLMPPDHLIDTVTVTATNDVTISSVVYNYSSCQFVIDALPAAAETAGSFQVTAHVIKTNGEEFDVTLLFKVAER